MYRTVLVGNLPLEVSASFATDLSTYMSRAGSVEGILCDLGVAFVMYESKESAQRAIRDLDGTYLSDLECVITVQST